MDKKEQYGFFKTEFIILTIDRTDSMLLENSTILPEEAL